MSGYGEGDHYRLWLRAKATTIGCVSWGIWPHSARLSLYLRSATYDKDSYPYLITYDKAPWLWLAAYGRSLPPPWPAWLYWVFYALLRLNLSGQGEGY